MKKLDRKHLQRKFDNYSVEDWLEKDDWEGLIPLEIEDEVGKGKGLIARRKFEVNDTIGFYRGKRLTEAEYMKKHQDGDNEYIFVNKENKLYIDATEDKNCLARYINDSNNEKPNARTKIYTDRSGKKHIQIVCCREINVGDEIHYDYKGEFMPWRKQKVIESETASTLPYASSISVDFEKNDDTPDNSFDEIQTIMEAENIGNSDEEDSVDASEELFRESDENCIDNEPLSPPALHPKPSIINSEGDRKEIFLTTRFKQTDYPPITSKRKTDNAVEIAAKHKEAKIDKKTITFQSTTRERETGMHCLFCKYPMESEREMAFHRFVCEHKDDVFPDETFSYRETGADKYYLCIKCLGLCCQSQHPQFRKHVEKESGAWSEEFYMIIKLDRESEAPKIKSNVEIIEKCATSNTDQLQVSTSSAPYSVREITDDTLTYCSACKSNGLSRPNKLRAHLENVHHVDKKYLSIITRVMLLENSNRRDRTNEKKYVCLHEDCHIMYGRRGDHTSEHVEERRLVRTLSDLPEYITKELEKRVTVEEEIKTPHGKIDFALHLQEFKNMVILEWQRNEHDVISPENVDLVCSRVKDCLVLTEGLTKVYKIAEWLNQYEKVRAESTMQNWLKHLQRFVDFLLTRIEYGSKNPYLDIVVIEKEISKRIKALNRPKAIRNNIFIDGEGEQLPDRATLSIWAGAVQDYLEEKLSDIDSISERDYRLVQYNLIALLIMYSGLRAGTIIKIKRNYLQSMYFDEEYQVYGMKLIPPEVAELRMGTGQRERIALIAKSVGHTHKNFKFSGKKIVTLTQMLKDILDKYLDLRTKMEQDNEAYLFCPLSLTNPSEKQLLNVMKNYWRGFQKQHDAVNFNGDKFRKAISTHFALTIQDPNAMKAIYEQMGHSSAVARNNYEIGRNKLKSSAFTSLLLSRDLSRGAITNTGASSSNEIENDDTNSDPETDDDYEAEQDTDIEDDEGNSDMVRAEKLQGYPPAEEIAQFFVHRKKRNTLSNRIKYDHSVYLYLAEIYLKDKKGNLKSRRSAILCNPLGFTMDLDHARELFKRADTWIANGAEKFWLQN